MARWLAALVVAMVVFSVGAASAQETTGAAAWEIDGIAEGFNVFDSAHWTIETGESNRQFGQRVAGENRTAQCGFRLAF